MSITPYLYYQDGAGALKFLAKAFGFRKYGVQMRRPDGKINHAAMKFGAYLIMMGYPGPQYKNPKRLGEATQSLYINVDDVDTHFQRARRSGAAILEEPKDTSYGPRRDGAEDPEGHQWYFAEDISKGSKPRRQEILRNCDKPIPPCLVSCSTQEFLLLSLAFQRLSLFSSIAFLSFLPR
jgi:PhnB protein